MNSLALDSPALSAGGSPLSMVAMLVLGFLLGVVLLIGIVRWTEGFSLSFWAACKMTAITLVVVTACELGVFALTLHSGLPAMTGYWLALAITLALSIVISTVIYAYGVKRPNGEQIGIGRAMKVTLIQLFASIAVLVVIAIVIAVLMLNGVIPMPQLPQGL